MAALLLTDAAAEGQGSPRSRRHAAISALGGPPSRSPDQDRRGASLCAGARASRHGRRVDQGRGTRCGARG
eukprot:scaffold1449_cov324-Prasinococcus_capsulatus_cf.AAC.4